MNQLSQPNQRLAEAHPFAGISLLNTNAAGVDIGAHEIKVCIPADENMVSSQ